MLDPRVIAGIALMAIGAVIVKLVEFHDWYVHQQPVIDTSSNGGVKRAQFIPGHRA